MVHLVGDQEDDAPRVRVPVDPVDAFLLEGEIPDGKDLVHEQDVGIA